MFSLKSTLNTLQKISIICENKTLMTNNGAMEEISAVIIEFDVNFNKTIENPREVCPRICKSLQIPDRSCDTYCIRPYKRWVSILGNKNVSFQTNGNNCSMVLKYTHLPCR